ncbi:hypothetical protein AYO42_06475 [Rhizomicrobium sp. SCGC AG-212-E05]|nr:hypothetical protein AYO42_06475 [Rhizomicrobium sp. SCGC AG-212-E05]
MAFSIALSGTALAQPQPSSPLPAGQPAGLKQAQRGDNTLALILGVGAIAGGIALVAANNGSDNNPVTSTTTTAP